MKQRMLLASLGCLLLWSAGATASVTVHEKGELSLSTAGVERILVKNARGTVTARAGKGQKIQMTAIKNVRARDDEQAREMAREIEVETDHDGTTLVISVSYPKRTTMRVNFWDFSSLRWPRVDVDLTLEIPAKLPVDFRSASGDLFTQGLAGDQQLESVSGDVEVHDAGAKISASTTSGDLMVFGVGSATLHTVSGDLKVEDARGPLRIESTSGDISITGASDLVSIVTVSGTVRVEDAPRGLSGRSTSGDILAGEAGGAVQLRTVSGDVHVVLTKRLSRADISSSSGDLDVRLGPELGVALDLKTSSGSLDVFVPLDSQQVSRRSISGVVGTGSTQVVLRTSSGDIDVRKGG